MIELKQQILSVIIYCYDQVMTCFQEHIGSLRREKYFLREEIKEKSDDKNTHQQSRTINSQIKYVANTCQ